MPVKQILNRCTSPWMRFRWTINPYRGCEFGCVYCYARYTHEFLELRDPMDFERRIFVKRMAAEVLARTLSRTPIGQFFVDHAQSQASANPRTGRPACLPALAGAQGIEGGGYSMPPADDADDPGAHGQCGGNRGGDTCGARCGRVRLVVAFAVPEAGCGAPLPPVYPGELPRR